MIQLREYLCAVTICAYLPNIPSIMSFIIGMLQPNNEDICVCELKHGAKIAKH